MKGYNQRVESVKGVRLIILSLRFRINKDVGLRVNARVIWVEV